MGRQSWRSVKSPFGSNRKLSGPPNEYLRQARWICAWRRAKSNADHEQRAVNPASSADALPVSC